MFNNYFAAFARFILPVKKVLGRPADSVTVAAVPVRFIPPNLQ
jgi:hypothetical protein